MSVYKTPILIQHLPNLASDQAVRLALKKNFPNQEIADFNCTFFNSSFENLSIDLIREVGRELAFTNLNNQTRFLIIYCLDKSSLEAQNALLKNLEEPPANTQIILTGTDLSNILPTIFSRVQVFQLSEDATQSQTIIDDATKSNYEKILTKPLATLLELTDMPSTKEDALNFFRNFLLHLDTEIHSEKTQLQSSMVFYYAKVMQKTVVLIEQIQKNVNLKLAIDNFFLEIKKT